MLPQRFLRFVGPPCIFFPFVPAPLAGQTAPSISAPVVLHIDGLGKGAALLDGPWQFHLGDNSAWALPQTPDATGVSGWESISANQPWGMQGHFGYVGYAWYRKHLQLSPAPGASPDLVLLMRQTEDVYEIYWNGRFIGRHGAMPPHPRYTMSWDSPWYTFGVGPARDGVLAIRVWKGPLISTDTGLGGGLHAAPDIGNARAIAALKTEDDYGWMRSQQFTFGLLSLYGVLAFLSLIAWFRDRSHRVLLWLAVFSGMPVLAVFIDGLRLPWNAMTALGWLQPVLGLEDIGLWFVLLYLFRFDEDPRLVRITRWLAVIDFTAFLLDGPILELFNWSSPEQASVLQGADAALTAVYTLSEFYPFVLLALALRKRLDLPRWLLAISALLTEMLLSMQFAFQQGRRFTHWTFDEKITAPLFWVNGNPFTARAIAATLLLLSIIYAVYRYLQETSVRQAALEQEFQSARELQRVLIPETLPELPGYAVTSAYQPAQEVGGDFFQIIPLEGAFARSTLIVLGDVSGKGLRAAMAVSLIVGAVRTLAKFSPRPAELLAELNQRLCGRLQGGFATCIAVLLARDGRCVIASAGHPPPFLNRRELALPGALPLGVVASADYRETTLQLDSGDHFALYTDGLLEARNAGGEIFGFARLDALFARRPAAAEATEAAVQFGQEDDITVLTLTRLASGQQSTTQLTIPIFAGA